MQTIVIGHPPMWEEIRAAFPRAAAQKGVIFSWGRKIFNPDNVRLDAGLIAHEAVHGQRQGTEEMHVKDWWRRYIDDRQFRLDEEIPAHIAEMKRMVAADPSRNNRRSTISRLATRLSSPLYGRLLSSTTVRTLLKAHFSHAEVEHDDELKRKLERIETLPDGRIKVAELR